MYPVDTIIMYAKRVDFLLMLNQFSKYIYNILLGLGTEIFSNFSIYLTSHCATSCNVWDIQYPIAFICKAQNFYTMETRHNKEIYVKVFYDYSYTVRLTVCFEFNVILSHVFVITLSYVFLLLGKYDELSRYGGELWTIGWWANWCLEKLRKSSCYQPCSLSGNCWPNQK